MSVNAEVWKPVEGWPGYEISDLGRLRSWKRGGSRSREPVPRILAGGQDKDGYRRAVLHRPVRDTKSFRICSLVADAFLPPGGPGTVITHLNGNKTDDSATNLARRTQLENIHDKYRHGTMPMGEQVHSSKLTADEVLDIYSRRHKGSFYAKKYGINLSSVSAIWNGRTWCHVTGHERRRSITSAKRRVA